MRYRTTAAVLTLTLAVAMPAAQQPVEKVDLDAYAKIRDEGMNRSEVMDHISWLADVHGPRLTGGPQIEAAADWTEKRLAGWGLTNIRRERFAFGRGWSLVRFSGHMIEPQVQPLIGSVPPWTPGTPETITGDVVRVEITSEKDFERYRGTLKGAIVLTQPARDVRMLEGTVVHRMDADDIAEAFNLIADIPGTDPKLKDEIVIIGGHVDSVAAATGAVDNATGVSAMMEAVRILKAVGIQPRRTIRLALWGGEEQGLLGAREYVRQHIADVQTMTLKPMHEKVTAYFNSDNGTGRIRGVWLEGNTAVAPIFEQWIAPLKDLGVEGLSPWSVGSTDHVAFDAAGIPAFQFLVDRLEYRSRTHHSNMDFFDRVQRDDMVQHATVAAIFAYNAAMRDEKLPRKELPEPGER